MVPAGLELRAAEDLTARHYELVVLYAGLGAEGLQKRRRALEAVALLQPQLAQAALQAASYLLGALGATLMPTQE